MSLYSNLVYKFGDVLDKESVTFIGSDSKQLLGKHLAGPGKLVQLVDERVVHVPDDFLYVFFVNDETEIVGYIEFDTTDIVESVWALTDKDINSVYLLDKDFDGNYEVVTVAYGQEFNRHDVESWADDVLGAINVLDVLNVRGNRYTSSMCDGCCDPDGTLFKDVEEFEAVIDFSDDLAESMDELIGKLISNMKEISND
jgi:hypothetical protein